METRDNIILKINVPEQVDLDFIYDLYQTPGDVSQLIKCTAGSDSQWDLREKLYTYDLRAAVANTPVLCRRASEPGWVGGSEASQVSCVIASAPCCWERHERRPNYKSEPTESNEGNYSEFGKNRFLMPYFLSLPDYLRELFFFSLNIDQLPNVCFILRTDRHYMKKKFPWKTRSSIELLQTY